MIKTSNIYQTSKTRAKIMLAAIEGYSTVFETSLNELLNNNEVEHTFPISPSQETEKEYYAYFPNKEAAVDYYSKIRHTLGNLTLDAQDEYGATALMLSSFFGQDEAVNVSN